MSPYPFFPKVLDVTQALSNFIGMPTIDRMLALPGPSTLAYEHLLELVSTLTCNPPSHALVVSKHVALTLAHAAQRIWWPAPSLEVELHYIDDADTIVPSSMSNQMRLKVMQSPMYAAIAPRTFAPSKIEPESRTVTHQAVTMMNRYHLC